MKGKSTKQTEKTDSYKPKCRFQGDNHWTDIFESNENQAEGGFSVTKKLRDRLGQVLTTNNVILLFGSGASVSIGGPSMQKLWSNAKTADAKIFDAICTAVKHPPDDENIEKLLNCCQRAVEFDVAKKDEVLGFKKRVETMIAKECRGIDNWQSGKNLSDILEPYKSMLSRTVPRRQNLPRTKIFTTNYDLTIEMAAKEKRMPFLDGFDIVEPRSYDGRWFDYDYVRRDNQNGVPDYLESVFHLYKLHGSVDWSRTSEMIIRDSQTTEPYMIYPRNDKYELSFEQPFLEMMARFQMALRQPDTAVVIIGFGFNDNHLNQPVYNALATNPSLKVLIADYNPEKKLVDTGEWHVLHKLQQAGAPLDFIQIDFKELPTLFPTYSEAYASNTQAKAAQLLRVLSSNQ